MNRGGWRLARCLIALALLSLLCGCTQSDDQGSLFQDDFGDQRSGWGEDRREKLCSLQAANAMTCGVPHLPPIVYPPPFLTSSLPPFLAG